MPEEYLRLSSFEFTYRERPEVLNRPLNFAVATALFFAFPSLAFQAVSASPDASLPWFAPLGVGGILAGIMFMFYRQDHKALEEIAKEQLAATKATAIAVTRLTDTIDNFDDKLSKINRTVDSIQLHNK